MAGTYIAPQEQLLERIRFTNPWWTEGVVDPYYRKFQPRFAFESFCSLVTNLQIERAVVLMGPRRIGKTVMLFHTIQHLLDQGVAPTNIVYLSVDTPLFTGIPLEELLQLFLLARNKAYDRQEQLYVIYDEVQYLKDWERHLKSLMDTYKNVRFVVSGSAAAALKRQSTESGAGRFRDFELMPLSFAEFVKFKDEDNISLENLNRLFIEYVNYGGYPESIQYKSPSDYSFIKGDIIDKVLLKDLPSVYGIEDTIELNQLFTSLAYNTGREVSLESLSKHSGVSKNTLKKYITYLEAAYLIRIIHRVDRDGKRFQRATTFKVYLLNPSIRTALFSPVEDATPEIGPLIETALLGQVSHAKTDFTYARWGKFEVDLVEMDAGFVPIMPIEVKWQEDKPTKSELGGLVEFCRMNHLEYALVSTKKYSGRERIEGVEIIYIPTGFYAYWLAENAHKDFVSRFTHFEAIQAKFN